MKTRIFYTKTWKDNYFFSLSRAEKLAFLYIIHNENNNLIGVYEFNDTEACLWTGLTQTELEDAKKKFHEEKKFYFVGDYVVITNHSKYNPYNGSKNETAREREESLLPKEVLDVYQNLNDRVSIGYQYPMHTSINHKSKTINHKSENKKEKTKNYEEIIVHFNEVFDKQTKSYASWQSNADHWLKHYSVSDVKKAISNWKYAKGFLGDVEPSLNFLFRTKNKAGECDYIDDLLNQKVKGYADDRLAVAARKAKNAKR